MKFSLGISNFPEEISSLSHSVAFLYFFALIAKEGFLTSLSLLFFGTLHSDVYIFFSFAFRFSYFTAICKASPDSHFAFLHFSSWGWS